MSEFRSVTVADLPLRTLREVSAMVADIAVAGGDYRAAMDVVVNSPRTPFLGVFLVAVALMLLVSEALD